MRTEEAILKTIRETGDLDDEAEQKLREAIEKFKETFVVKEEESLVS